ncbi:MAG: hypothetical protein JRI71_16155, partial [Deltaproteobacteria bacterium]|nr:hypothetical protein [Deltaproteobacteria bacterium]
AYRQNSMQRVFSGESSRPKKIVWCSKLVYKAFAAEHIKLVPPENSESITSEDLSRSGMVEKI